MDEGSGPRRDNWFEQNPKKTLAAVFVFRLVGLEVLLRVLVAAGLYPCQQYPSSFRPEFWDDFDSVLGDSFLEIFGVSAESRFTDLLRHAAAEGHAHCDNTLGCDPHWGPLGHQFAADVVFRVAFVTSTG